MTWPKYVLLAMYAISSVLTVSQVGKPRRPLTGGVAATTLVVSGIFEEPDYTFGGLFAAEGDGRG